MTEEKPWWMSRTIWTGLAASISAVLMASGVLPVWLTNTLIEETVIGLLGMATIYFRAKADKAIKPITTTPTTTVE